MTETTPAAPPPLRQRPAEDFATPTPRNGGAWSGLRPLLLRLHFYAGVLIGPFLLVAAVTGLLYTATPQIESVVYRHELKVTPHGEPEPLSAQVDSAREAIPGGRLVSVTKGAGDSDTTRVTFDVRGLPEGYTQTAFVDPYDAEVRGTLRTSGEWLPVRAWFDSLHRTLHLGEFGRNYSEIAASWLWVEVLGGLALWLGAPRGRERLRGLFVPRRGPKGRRRTLSWHGAAGLWVSAGFLALSATGLTWSAQAGVNIGKVQDALGGATPSVSSALGHGARGSGSAGADAGESSAATSAPRIDLDGAVRIARSEGCAASSSSLRLRTPGARTSFTRTRGTGRSSRTRSRSTRPPARSRTSWPSTTSPSSPSSRAGASTPTWDCSSVPPTRSLSRSSPSRSSECSSGATA